MQARSEKIAEEEEKCRDMAENAQRDLDEALPALEEAMKVSSGSNLFNAKYRIWHALTSWSVY